MKTNFLFLLGIVLVFTTACSSHAVATPRHASVATVVYVKKAPPRPKYEKIRHCRPNHVWVKGHWKWNGRVYVWIKGHCIKKRQTLVWVPGHWKHTSHGWYWVPGHWR